MREAGHHVCLFIVHPRNPGYGKMRSCLLVYPGYFMQKWTDEGGQDDAAPLGKFFCFRVVDLCGNVIQGFHQWCKNMDMGDI